MSQTATTSLARQVNGVEVPAAGTYAIDPTHTNAGFVARHLMVSKVRGRFSEVAGTFNIAEDPTQSSVEAVIKTKSIDTNEATRDAHLRSADFFDAETYPELTFRSTAVRPAGKAWKIEGDLTIKDISRPVVLDLSFDGAIKDPWGGTRVGFSARTEIDREDWGLTWNAALETGGVVVSKKITIELEVEGVQQPPA